MLWLGGAEAVVTVGEKRDDEERGAHEACQMSGGTEGISAPPREGLCRGCSVVGHMAARGAAAAWPWDPLEALGTHDRVGTVNCRRKDYHRHEPVGERFVVGACLSVPCDRMDVEAAAKREVYDGKLQRVRRMTMVRGLLI